MIQVLKTFEISDSLWQQIADGFNESFEGHHVTPESLKSGFYVRNQWGYAYHAIDFDESGDIRGFNTFTPTLYMNDMKVLVSGSSFVKQKYRKDVFVFFDMVQALKKKGSEEGFVLSIGVPNKNSFNYSLKILKASFVGYLDYYILPRNISLCIRISSLRFFDGLSRLFATIYISSQILISNIINTKERNVKYALVVDDEYYQARFGTGGYRKYEKGQYFAYYCIVDEGGIQTAYLLDFREGKERTKRAMAKAVKFILQNEKPDAVLFVGLLHLSQHVLLKVPERFVPKPLPLTCSILNKTDKGNFSDVTDVRNWNFSLMNFDVR